MLAKKAGEVAENGKTYYTGADGKLIQGYVVVNGQVNYYGDNNTYYKRYNSDESGYIQMGADGWRWLENGQLYTGFRSYYGAYYYFINGVRQENRWVKEWGNTYYVGADGRSVQGDAYIIDGVAYNFGTNGTFNLRGTASGYLYDGSQSNGGYRWYEDGNLYTGFRYYTGTYYWFVDGVRQNEGWREAWGYKYWTNKEGRAVQGWQTINGQRYYFGNDGTYYLR